MWQGSALADFRYEPFAQAEIVRLEELHLTCLEERVEADLARALTSVLVPELRRLIRDHPARERLRGQLMRALYLNGQQAEALEVYRPAATRSPTVNMTKSAGSGIGAAPART